MGFMGRKSQLKSDVIKKVWLNRKNYKYLDFEFKVKDLQETWFGDEFKVEVYNHNILIFKLSVLDDKSKIDERFLFEIEYFNPQTDNDCYSINHILGVCSEFTRKEDKHKDRGNAEIFQNQFIFRKKKNYYSYVRIWTRGDVKEENYDKQLSYEFATDEYIAYIKNIFQIKRLERRKIKTHIKDFLNKIILLEKLK